MDTQPPLPRIVIDDPDGSILADIQGNILRGYNMSYVRHIVVQVTDADAARTFIGDVISGADHVPQLTTAEPWETGAKPTTTLNVGVTATGLRALGLDEASVASFPEEFHDGAAKRAHKVGDVDASAPDRWRDGLGDPDKAHLMWTVYAFDDQAELEAVCARIEAVWKRTGAFSVTSRFDGATLDTYSGDAADHDTVHFGYRDSIAQPRFWVNGGPVGRDDSQPVAPVGAVLLGRVGTGPDDRPAEHYRTTFPGVSWRMPEVRDGLDVFEIGVNGCFNAFRVLEQDVSAFEDFLERGAGDVNDELDRRRGKGDESVADQPVWDRERVAAKLLGRWRNGVPLSPSSWTERGRTAKPFMGPGLPPPMDQALLNNFDYPDEDAAFDDSEGAQCPMASHIRRANPRDSRIVQRSANYTRPIVRRGMPYGPPFDPDNPDDGVERGLLGSFMCASLIAQFEAVMYDWINLGLQDPRVTGSNDPIIGANDVETSRFDIPIEGSDPIVLTGFPRFTSTVAGIYLFVPSVRALEFLARPPATR